MGPSGMRVLADRLWEMSSEPAIDAPFGSSTDAVHPRLALLIIPGAPPESASQGRPPSSCGGRRGGSCLEGGGTARRSAAVGGGGGGGEFHSGGLLKLEVKDLRGPAMHELV